MWSASMGSMVITPVRLIGVLIVLTLIADVWLRFGAQPSQVHTIEHRNIAPVTTVTPVAAPISCTSCPPMLPLPPLASVNSSTSIIPYNGGTEFFNLASADEDHARTLITFAYHHGGDGPINAAYFFLVGVQPYINNPHVDFLILLMSDISVDLPAGNNIFVHRRRNYGMDMCAWSETMLEPLLSSLTGHTLESYRYFIWMNKSVRGPFLPSGAQLNSWLPYFLSQVNVRDKLIGTTINCLHRGDRDIHGGGAPYEYGRAHLQSMFLVFDWRVLNTMLKHCPCSDDVGTTIDKGEIMLTRAVLQAGYGIQSQMLSFRGVNWANESDADAACEFDNISHGEIDLRDRASHHQYFGIDVHPLELIFIKTNRGILPRYIEHYTNWHVRAAQRLYPNGYRYTFAAPAIPPRAAKKTTE